MGRAKSASQSSQPVKGASFFFKLRTMPARSAKSRAVVLADVQLTQDIIALGGDAADLALIEAIPHDQDPHDDAVDYPPVALQDVVSLLSCIARLRWVYRKHCKWI